MSLVVSATGGILDISGEGNSMGIKYIDTFGKYILTGNVDTCEWVLDDVGGSG